MGVGPSFTAGRPCPLTPRGPHLLPSAPRVSSSSRGAAMRRFFSLSAVLLIALLCGEGQAQQPLPLTPSVSTSLQAPACDCPPPVDPGLLPGYAQRSFGEPLFAVELLLGQE